MVPRFKNLEVLELRFGIDDNAQNSCALQRKGCDQLAQALMVYEPVASLRKIVINSWMYQSGCIGAPVSMDGLKHISPSITSLSSTIPRLFQHLKFLNLNMRCAITPQLFSPEGCQQPQWPSMKHFNVCFQAPLARELRSKEETRHEDSEGSLYSEDTEPGSDTFSEDEHDPLYLDHGGGRHYGCHIDLKKLNDILVAAARSASGMPHLQSMCIEARDGEWVTPWYMSFMEGGMDRIEIDCDCQYTSYCHHIKWFKHQKPLKDYPSLHWVLDENDNAYIYNTTEVNRIWQEVKNSDGNLQILEQTWKAGSDNLKTVEPGSGIHCSPLFIWG